MIRHWDGCVLDDMDNLNGLSALVPPKALGPFLR